MKEFQDQKPIHGKIKLDSLIGFKPINNLVLCKSLYDNEEDRTKAGVYKMSPAMNKNEFLHSHANRIVEVVKVPDGLTFKSKPTNTKYTYTGNWICDMELKEGDIAWVTGSHAVNNLQVAINGDTYELMNYFEFIVAKRRSTHRDMSKRLKGKYIEEDDVFWEIIPLNGYVICEETKEIHEFGEYKNETIDKSRGIVRFIGKPNRGYFKNNRIIDMDGGYDLKYGDLVLKTKEAIASGMHPNLESEEHLRFNGDKTYFYLHRKYLDCTLN